MFSADSIVPQYEALYRRVLATYLTSSVTVAISGGQTASYALFAIGNSDCSREHAKTFGVENLISAKSPVRRIRPCSANSVALKLAFVCPGAPLLLRVGVPGKRKKTNEAADSDALDHVDRFRRERQRTSALHCHAYRQRLRLGCSW